MIKIFINACLMIHIIVFFYGWASKGHVIQGTEREIENSFINHLNILGEFQPFGVYS